MEIITTSTEDTMAFGAQLSPTLKGGMVLLLSGNLGAGKTALVKGIAKGFGITNEITSPTFALMNMYPISGRLPDVDQLIHIDTYRLKNEAELIEIGVEDYLGKPNTVCIIEWPEKITSLLERIEKTKIMTISIEQLEEAGSRRILLS
mgnify:CR=1 FL=1